MSLDLLSCTATMCLYPGLTQASQPMPSCPATSSSSDSLSISWAEPQITSVCQSQLYAFPTLNYHVTYHMVAFPDQVTVVFYCN